MTDKGWLENQVKIHDGFADDSYGSDSWQASKLAAIESYLAALPARPRVIVDVGCFSGALSVRLLPFADRVIGVDIHRDALLEARRKGIHALCADLGADAGMPLATGTADAIVCADVIEHLVNPRPLMNEARRILKPGGAMILSTPNMGYWLSRLRLVFGRPPMCTNGVAPGFRSDHWVDPSHVHVNLLSEWTAFFVDCGWRVEEIRGSHLSFGGRRRAAAHLVDKLCDRFWPALSLVPVLKLSVV